jgi:hypothetical protein
MQSEYQNRGLQFWQLQAISYLMAAIAESCTHGREQVFEQLHHNAATNALPLRHINEDVRPIVIDCGKRLDCASDAVLDSFLDDWMLTSLHERLHCFSSLGSEQNIAPFPDPDGNTLPDIFCHCETRPRFEHEPRVMQYD